MAIFAVYSIVQLAPLAFLAAVLYYAYWQLTVGSARRRLIKTYGCRPPNRVVNTFLGSIFSRKLVRQISSAHGARKLREVTQQRYLDFGYTHLGKIYHLDWLYTVEAENVQTILSTNFKDYELPARRKSAFLPLLGRGIFTSDSVAWKYSRALVRPSFERDNISDLAHLEEHFRNMIRVIPKDGESTVDFMELFFNLTMDSITEFLFGKSSYCLLSGSSPEAVINTRFAEAFNRALQEILRRFFVGFFHFKSQQFKDDIKFVHNYVDRYVQEALQYREAYLLDPSQAESQFGHGRYVFMHELVKRVADPVVIRTELLNVLMAGRDTTATLLSNVWYTLARRPDVYSKLRKETVETLGGTKPTLRQLQKMKYLSYIIDESQRLDPVAPFNSRMAVVDTVLPLGGGPDGKSPLLVPKGQNVSYSLYTMHRRKDYFGDDADEFRPERWETIRPTWTFLPFNGGPRICVGQQYALNEAKYITIRLVQEFAAIEPRDDKPWTENVTLSTWNLHGTKIALTPV